MKKLKNLIYSLFVIAIFSCSLLFVGCKKPEGTYKLSGLAYLENDTTHKVALGEKYEGEVLKEDTFILTINQDNTAVIRTIDEEDVEAMVCQWAKGYNDEIYLYQIGDSEAIIFKKTDDGYMLDFYEVQLFLVKD